MFFIEEYGEPFGTSPIAFSTAVLQLDDDKRVLRGSTQFRDLEGSTVTDVFDGLS